MAPRGIPAEEIPSLPLRTGLNLCQRHLAAVESQWRFRWGRSRRPDARSCTRDGWRRRGRSTGPYRRHGRRCVGRPFDAATCILILRLVPDDGAKLELLRQTRRRLKPAAPFVLVDQCLVGARRTSPSAWTAARPMREVRASMTKLSRARGLGLPLWKAWRLRGATSNRWPKPVSVTWSSSILEWQEGRVFLRVMLGVAREAGSGLATVR